MENKEYYERQLITSHGQLESREFWLRQLTGEIRKSTFPYDFIDTDKEYNRDNIQLNFSRELVSKLLTASKQSDHALHIILAAGLTLLLDKYNYRDTNDNDIIIGSPIYRQDTEGEFINTILPLRVRVDDQLSFKDLLMRMKQTVLQAVDHQNYPIELLVEQLDLKPMSMFEKDFPLFDTAVLLENVHNPKYLQHISINTIFSFSRKDLTVSGKLEYNTQRFTEARIRQIGNHFTALLNNALFNPGLELSQIDVLTEDEKKQVMVEFNQTHADFPSHRTLHQFFEEQARRRPSNTAIIGPPYPLTGQTADKNKPDSTELQKMSFKTLNEKADQLAHILVRKGVTVGSVVPIIVERSIDMALGIIAILKAGGAYLPIEPNNPGYRILYLLNDSGAPLLLTHRNLYELGMAERNGKDLHIEPVFIEEQLVDADPDSLTTSHSDGLFTGPNELAYVIYTSGTTGRPKGTMVEHRSVVNYTHWRINNYGLSETDITLQLLSYSFDGWGTNFYSSLFTGGCLVMVPEIKRLDYEYINTVAKERGVTHISLVPTMYEAILNCSEDGDLNTLKSVVLGGEKAVEYLIKRGVEKNPAVCHIIEYGPTEATMAAAANRGITPAETSIIGKPIANTRIFILSRSFTPQPRGTAGELFVAGTGLARGYLNNPEMTAGKFMHLVLLPNDRHPMTNDLLYRTGDLARWLPDGNIEFLGRIDNQVKIKGFRVELEEIEKHLHQHQDIAECILVTRSVNRDNRQDIDLAAYYIKKKNSKEALTPNTLRKFLFDRLPDYMIPAHFIELEVFPLTANGKIDRKALASAEEFAIKTEKSEDQPLNEIEHRIIEVWQDVLATKHIKTTGNFFSIGGTSLKALTVVSLLGKELTINIDQIYQHGSIAEIAEHVTWQKDSMKSRILEYKENLYNANVETRNEIKKRDKQLSREYKAYKKQIKPKNIPSLYESTDYRHILLTGGTAPLGAYLIDELLRVTNSQLHLLVKANSQEEAEESIKQKLAHYFGENYFEKNQKRLQVYHGDIRDERLGIRDEQYEHLSKTIDAVVHTAANVRHYGMYDDFYRTNVTGTEHLLMLAEKNKKKDFHQMSTLGVGQGKIEGKHTLLFNEFVHDVGQKIANLYLGTKFEAEKKILLYREKGINASIYRFGHLAANSKTGIFQKDLEMDGFYAILKGFITLGMIPEMQGLFLNILFADYAADAFVKLMTRKNLVNQTYHLNNENKMKWTELVPMLNKINIDIKVATIEEFLDHLMVCMDKEDSKYIQATSRILLHSGLFGEKADNQGISGSTSIRFCVDRTRFILKKLGFEWVNPNEIHIRKMVRHCQKVGFIQ